MKPSARAVRPLAVLLLAASVVLGVSACASSAGSGTIDGGGDNRGSNSVEKAVDDYPGLPEGMVGLPQNPSGEPQLYWLQGATQIGITLWGSSTCPPTVDTLTVTSSNAFTAQLAELPAKPCTRDLVPHTTVFDTPSGTTPSSDVTVVIDGTSYTLPGQRS